jgi:hypothetical protein
MNAKVQLFIQLLLPLATNCIEQGIHLKFIN